MIQNGEKRMQLTIDTSKDSHDDIRHAIAMLQSILAKGKVYTNDTRDIFAQPTPGESGAAPPSQNLFAMFDAAPAAQASSADTGEPEPAVQENHSIELY
ncbi:MAG: hypothetical protein AABY13_04185 [Nanoarchaeota archaeon]